MIPQSFIEELKYRLNIEEVVSSYVPLKRAGKNLKGLCPFHSEKTPSFTVFPDTNSYYCFGCGSGGDPITFIKNIEHLEYVEALRFAAQRVGLPMPEDVKDDKTAEIKRRILEINRLSARFFYSALISQKGRAGYSYLRKRGLSDETIKAFGLGFAPDSWHDLCDFLIKKGYTKEEIIAANMGRESDRGNIYDLFRNRVMFPIIDLRGSVIGFGGRVLDDRKPKYLNSPDTPVFKKTHNIFGLNIAKNQKDDSLILTEGYMDTISLHAAGFKTAIATLGTALTSDQARLISSYAKEVIICYDSDEAGRKATERAVGIFSETGIKVRVLNLKGAKDPDEFIKKRGREAFREVLEKSLNSTENQIELLKKKYDIDTEDGKLYFLKEFCLLMAHIEDKLAAEVYISKVSLSLGISKDAIVEEVNSLKKKDFYREKKKFELTPPSRRMQDEEFSKDPQRQKYFKYAKCEDKLLLFLYKNPNSIPLIKEKLPPKAWATDSNREIYELMLSFYEDNISLDISSLAAYLKDEQVSRFSGIIANLGETNISLETANELCRIILSLQNEKSADEISHMDMDELGAFANELMKNKK